MLKLNKLLILGLSCIFSKELLCQNIYENPDSLYQVKDYSNAAIGFERKIYFKTNHMAPSDSIGLENYYYRLALCYKKIGDFQKAYNTLLYIDNKSDQSYNINYQKLMLSYLSNDFATTELEYSRSNMIKENDMRHNSLLILSLHELGKWQEANLLVRNSSFLLPIDSTQRLNLLNEYNEVPKFKNSKKAEALNTFLPGSGYLYLGKTKDALILMGLQTISLGLTAGLVYNKLYFTGGAIGLGLFEKFRRGSTSRALLFTEDVNLIKKYEYNSKLKSYLIE